MNCLRPLASTSLPSSSSLSSFLLAHSSAPLRHFSSVRRGHASMAAFRDFLANRKNTEPQKFPNVTLPSLAESTRRILGSKQKLPRSFLEADGSRTPLPLPLAPQTPPPAENKFPTPPPLFVSRAIRSVSRAAHLSIQIVPGKLNDICRRVRGLHVDEALVQLRFAQKRKAVFVANAIRHAALNGVRNFQMDRSRLYVSQAYIGKGMFYKRTDFRARGKIGLKRKYHAHLFVEVKEQPTNPAELRPDQPPKGSPYQGALEVRVGRFGRRSVTLEKTKSVLKNYTQAKKELGLRETEPIPVSRRVAEVNDYSQVLRLATQVALQNAGAAPAAQAQVKA